jgi:dihydroorotase
MPNTKPMVLTTDDLKNKISAIKGRANVDYGLFAALSPLDSPEPVEKISWLVMGLKLYMAETTGALGTTDKDLESLLGSKNLAGKVVTVHAEDSSMFNSLTCTSLAMHNLVRNMRAEVSAVRKLLAVKTQATLNLAHLTTRESLELARSSNVRFEITPQHFLLHDKSDIGSYGKVNPPLRHRDVAARLFKEVREGRVDIIASDHAPHTLEEKSRRFNVAPSGMPGVETRLPLMMALVKRNKVALGTVQMACCQKPGELFNMEKGRLVPGYDADLCFFNMKQMEKIKGENLHSKCCWSAFEGFEAVFPETVMLRGQWVVKERELEKEKVGRMLNPYAQNI